MILPAVTTHYSLLSGFIKPEEASRKCVELGYSHCLLSDDNLSGMVDFYVSMKKVGVTPVIGLRASGGHYIAKTLKGYKELLKISSGEDAGSSSSDLQFYANDELKLMEVRYAEKKDAMLHRILLCGNEKHKTTMNKIHSTELGENRRFFESDEYYFKKIDYQYKENLRLFDELESYDILSRPKLPKVECGNVSEAEFLTELCREGWRRKFSHLTGDLKDKYVARVKEELGVINGFGLSGYFLIVQDIINYVRENGWLPGPGRGSAAGSLVSYLVGITDVDPIQYNLLFSRFLNSGRFSDGNVSLPDIDMDVPSGHRDEIIGYIRNKYGHDRVGQMITLGRLQGRSVIKEISRAYSNLSFAELNEITESLPQEASISDELEEMGISSVITWVLENDSKRFSKWCVKNDDGSLSGELSELFDIAIRMEGTYKSRGVHAAGVVISNEPLINDAPIMDSKTGKRVVGLEMSDADKVGLVKFDVLGSEFLDKVMEICYDD